MRTASETLDLEGLLQFCETHDQETKVHAVISAGSIRAAARELGVQYNSVYGTIYMLRARAALKGYAPSHGWHALRRAMAISYHKDHGEWSRHIVNPGMLS
jgi:hypothetical protein